MAGRVLISIALVAGSVAALALAPTSAAAQAVGGIDECDANPAPDWCLQDQLPGSSSPSDNDDSPPVRETGAAPTCGWETLPPGEVGGLPRGASPQPGLPVSLASGSSGSLTNGVPTPGLEVVWQGWCYSAPRDPADLVLLRWVPVGTPATAIDVALGVLERLEGRMPDPVVVSSPPVGVDAVVEVPVFVSVTNWQAELIETGDLLGNIVTVRATADVLVNPAEPGSTAQTCAGPGTPYDPAGGDLWVQAAAPGACTLTYHLRTGAEGRPEQWPSTVTVRWSISWSATSGESGAFPVVERVVSLPRGVGEVQAVVVSGGG